MAKKSTPETTESPADLEHSLQALEMLVERMEHGELSLEQALADFEQGIALVRRCETVLKAAEQKVQILIERSGHSELAPFVAEGEE